jgi:two-component system cell cycle sensor histidine kinase/response regulator CckA
MSIPNSAGDSLAARPEDLATARAQLEAERGRVAALALFARRMSHDMSNFVTVVRTYSELLLADLPATSATHADVLEIHRAADAMIEYMQRIAGFARSSSGRAATVVLDDVVGEVVREPSSQQRVREQLASKASVRIDASLLVDALRELLANAREASPAGATVHVTSWREVAAAPLVDGGMPIEAGTWAVVQFADEGAGFSSDANRQSLDPFVTTKVGVRGAGFGLALARGVAWQAGGQLVLGPARGAKPGGSIRLWLPADLSSSP